MVSYYELDNLVGLSRLDEWLSIDVMNFWTHQDEDLKLQNSIETLKQALDHQSQACPALQYKCQRCNIVQ